MYLMVIFLSYLLIQSIRAFTIWLRKLLERLGQLISFVSIVKVAQISNNWANN